MKNMKKVNLELNSNIGFLADDNPEFAIAKLDFLSTRENSHKLMISEDVLRKNGNSAIGKPLVAKLNSLETDVQGHEVDEQIFGWIPNNQEVEFRISDDNKSVIATAEAVISKIYADKFYNIFMDKDNRSVSVEMLCSTEEKGSENIVTDFCITGVTVLGKDVLPSCSDANIQIVSFSEKNAEQYFNDFKDKNIELSEISRKLDNISSKLDNKKKEETTDMNKKKIDAKLEESKLDEPKMEEPKVEEPKKEETKLEDEPKKDEPEQAKPKEEEPKKDEEINMSLLNKKIELLEKEIGAKDSKIKELQKFKDDALKAEMSVKIEKTLSEIKGEVSEELFATFEKEAKDCSTETLDAWTTNVFAEVVNSLLQKTKRKTKLKV